MKLIVAVCAVLFAVAVTNVHADDSNEIDVADKVPASVVLEALKSAAEQGVEFLSVDDVVAAVDVHSENPMLRGIFKKCKSGDCRKKCNAKGQNGACVWIKCVCWK